MRLFRIRRFQASASSRTWCIKNVVKNPRIIIGDYTYYDDVDGADQFEKHVTHFYDFIGDRLIIGKFCAIAKGIEFVMNGANHRMDGVTTYPFYVIGGDRSQLCCCLRHSSIRYCRG